MNRTCDLATHAEPLTGRAALTGTSLMLHSEMRLGGAGRDRTDDLKLAKLALSQLSYAPLRPSRCSGLRGAGPLAPEHQLLGGLPPEAPRWRGAKGGGPGWIRTTDLTLIRGAL